MATRAPHSRDALEDEKRQFESAYATAFNHVGRFIEDWLERAKAGHKALATIVSEERTKQQETKADKEGSAAANK